MHHHMEEKKLSIPAAIIIGAIIIGVAIIIAFGDTAKSQIAPTRLTIEQAAKKVRINQEDLTTCIAENRYADRIAADMENAQAVGMEGTPHSIVINAEGEAVSISGALPLEAWTNILATVTDPEFTPEETDPAKNIRPVDENDHVRGSENPIITIVEYSDIDCPFCQKLHGTLKTFLADNDNVRWVYRHMPITGLHPDAYKKAMATECVYELSGNNEAKFWKFLDLIVG